MIGVISILVFLALLSYVLSSRNIFSPGVLTGGIFALCLLFFVALPHRMPSLHEQCLWGVALWGGCFIVSSLFMQSFRYTDMPQKSSSAVLNLYFYLSILCIPLLGYFAFQAITTGSSSNMAMNLRDAAVNGLPSGPHKPYTPFYYMLWIATYLLYLKDVNKTKWRRAVIMGLLVLSFGIVTMSKTFILGLGVMTLFVLYYKRIISTRHILIGGAVLLVVLIGLQVIRQRMTLNEKHMFSMFEMYVMANFNAFDTLKPCSAEHWGENVFRLYYVLANKFGFTDIDPINPILPWVYTPVATNTYTVLYPFFLDFGYVGIAVFALLLGCATGWLYAHCRRGDEFFVLMYAYFCVLLVTQYNGEAFFTNLAGHIKFVLVLLLPYLSFPPIKKPVHEK